MFCTCGGSLSSRRRRQPNIHHRSASPGPAPSHHPDGFAVTACDKLLSNFLRLLPETAPTVAHLRSGHRAASTPCASCLQNTRSASERARARGGWVGWKVLSGMEGGWKRVFQFASLTCPSPLPAQRSVKPCLAIPADRFIESFAIKCHFINFTLGRAVLARRFHKFDVSPHFHGGLEA